MDTNKKVTIIICTYKRPAFLKRALDCALQQTCSDYLIHVFDDASGDETSEIVREYQNNSAQTIKYTQHQKNLGTIRNYANAIQQVETPFFCFTADDDFMLPNFVAHHLEVFNQNPELGLSVSQTLSCFENGEIQSINLPLGYYPPVVAARFFVGKTFFVGSILFRNNLKITGGIKPEVGEIFDQDFLYRCAFHFPIQVTNAFTMFHHTSRNSISHKYMNSKVVENVMCWQNLYQSLLEETAKLQSREEIELFFRHFRALIELLFFHFILGLLSQNRKNDVKKVYKSIHYSYVNLRTKIKFRYWIFLGNMYGTNSKIFKLFTKRLELHLNKKNAHFLDLGEYIVPIVPADQNHPNVKLSKCILNKYNFAFESA